MTPKWQHIADQMTDDDLIKGAENDSMAMHWLWNRFNASYEITDFLAQALAQRLKLAIEEIKAYEAVDALREGKLP